MLVSAELVAAVVDGVEHTVVRAAGGGEPAVAVAVATVVVEAYAAG